MEPLVLSFALAASFLLAWGLARAILLTLLRLAKIDEQSHHMIPIETSSAAAQGDGVPTGLLAA